MLHPRSVVVAVMLAVSSINSVGCAAFQRVVDKLSDVLALIADAQEVLRVLEIAFVVFADTQKLPPEVRDQFYKLSTRCHEALSAAANSARGAQDLSRNEVDKAFDQFKRAYGELQAFLNGVGLRRVGGNATANGFPVHDPTVVREFKMRGED